MKMPKEWDLTLKEGIISSEMVDACATAAIARTEMWQANLADATEDARRRPKSKVAKARLENAKYMVEFYAKQAQTVLSLTEPTTLTRVWSDVTGDYVNYASYDVMGHQFSVLVSKATAFDIVENYDVVVIEDTKAPTCKPVYTDLVSHYFVNRVIASIKIYGAEYQETSTFEPESESWAPTTLTSDEAEDERELFANFA